eukprot:TRINITY_DN150_c1_g1_i1.p2 TRINITY_DN150_c1_g1~~TRINITY_DN150_c1_g1_i1.p2  ORF type:complete len:104 (+),score=19.95 TRINITY_DN150_c1_g1_i1:472-783(+)
MFWRKLQDLILTKKLGRPLRNIRIRHTEIIENPFPDPKLENYRFPSRSPSPRRNKNDVEALEEDEDFSDDHRTQQEIEEEEKEREQNMQQNFSQWLEICHTKT